MAGSWIRGHGFWLLHAACWILDPGSWILYSGSWILYPVFWNQDRGSCFLDSVFWILDSGSWILDPGPWAMDMDPGFCSGPWVPGSWTPDPGTRIPDPTIGSSRVAAPILLGPRVSPSPSMPFVGRPWRHGCDAGRHKYYFTGSEGQARSPLGDPWNTSPGSPPPHCSSPDTGYRDLVILGPGARIPDPGSGGWYTMRDL